MVDTVKLNTRVEILKYLSVVYSDFYFSFNSNGKSFNETPPFELSSYSGSAKIFDLASITKALVTSCLILDRVQKQQIDPHASIGSCIKDTELDETLDYRIKNLSFYDIMKHKSGLPSWSNFYTDCCGQNSPKRDKDFIIKRLNFIAQNGGLSDSGSTNYSDLGFILLGLVLEQISKKNIDKMFQSLLSEIGFSCQEGFIGFSNQLEDKSLAIPTTPMCPLRKKMIQGEVHDENCYYLGGRCGHAGAFSDGKTLSLYIKTLFGSKLGEFIRTNVKNDLDRTHDLFSYGFRRGSLKDGSYYLSKTSFGHTGFTGGCFWVDDESSIVFLTNRTIYQRNYPMQELRSKVMKSFIVH